MPINRLVFLAALVAVGIVLYLTTAVQGDWGFVLLLRGKKLLAMLLVGGAIASATVVFQTLAANRILTPSIIGACLAWLWHKRHVLDILALGREQAINLGIHYPREQLTLMLTVALLVAVSTALVGPTLFFGLLVSALACRLFPVPYHAIQLPAACLLACATLVIGQTLFERVFHYTATLSILIEGIGGIVFLYLLLARKQP